MNGVIINSIRYKNVKPEHWLEYIYRSSGVYKQAWGGKAGREFVCFNIWCVNTVRLSEKKKNPVMLSR